MEIPSENHNTELKQSFDNDAIAKEIVAFLNAYDGKIYIGITKQRKAIGISPDNNKDKLDEIMLKVSNVIADQISPRCVEFVTIKHILLDRKDVIEIDVRKGNQFYYHKKYGMSEKGCFVREGTSAKPLMPEEIKRRYEETLNIQKPTIVEMRSRKQKLTFNVLKIYINSCKIFYEEDSFAETFNLLTPDGEYNEMAFLLSDQFNFSIKVARFEDDGGNLTMRKEFGDGCLFKIFNEVKDFMQSQINKPKTYFNHGIRRDEYLYDETAFVEAWKNAVLHNDYAERHYPAVYLYDDHLEVFSNGNPLKYDTLDEFLRGKSKPINDELMRLAIKLHITDQTGKGNKDIVRIYGKDVFEISENLLSVNIPYNPLAIEPHDAKNDAKNDAKTLEERIIDIIVYNNKVTRIEMAEIIGVSKATIERCIKKSVKIKYIGSKKGGHWEVLS